MQDFIKTKKLTNPYYGTCRRPLDILVTAINGKTGDGKPIAWTVNADDTIGDVKKKIQTTEGIQPNVQRLTFGGKPLEDNKVVSNYSIPNQGVLDLVVGTNQSEYKSN